MSGRWRLALIGLVLAGVSPALAQQGAPPPGDLPALETEYQGYHPEVVFFPSAKPPPPSAFKKKMAAKKGLTLEDPLPKTLLGRLYRPDGEGPFPAVVLLHGANGIWDWNDLWAERLRSWGYLVLDVDSMTPRGLYVHNTGQGSTAGGVARRYVDAFPRALDALGARAFLAAQPFVLADRIGVMGMSQGGSAALYSLSPRDRPPEVEGFAAAVALYPPCAQFDSFDAPLLVLSGAADEFVSADFCARELDLVQSDHELQFQLYPEVHHVFDFEGIEQRVTSALTLRYDREAAEDAEQRIKEFLARHLGG